MNTFIALLAAFALITTAQAEQRWPKLPSATCQGGYTYNVTVENRMTPNRFNSSIPADGLVFSPLVAISHSSRVSFAIEGAYASPELTEIAMTGDPSTMLQLAEQMRESGSVLGISSLDRPTLPGTSGTLTLQVDCNHPMVTVLAMIAPSPDWIVQVSSKVLVNRYFQTHVFEEAFGGELFAYDAGVDSGGDFTPPQDSGLDVPTMPKQNIVPLVQDHTDVFEGRPVGSYIIRRLV